MAAETVGAEGEEEVFVDSCALANHGLAKEDDALGCMACDKCHHKKLPKHMMNVGLVELSRCRDWALPQCVEVVRQCADLTRCDPWQVEAKGPLEARPPCPQVHGLGG